MLRLLKSIAGRAIAVSLRFPRAIMLLAVTAVVISGMAMLRLENDFLPPFDEGAVQINVVLPAGTSLKTSQEVAQKVEQRIRRIDEIAAFVRKTGRAELDEHAVPVSMSEFIATLEANTSEVAKRSLDDIRVALAEVPGIVTSVEQPLAHFISHMLSGVQAQIAIKLYGDELDVLRREALADRIGDRGCARSDRSAGRTAGRISRNCGSRSMVINSNSTGYDESDINEFVETAMHGDVVSEVLIGQRTFDLMVRFDESNREDIDAVKRLAIDFPNGGTTNLGSVARIYQDEGPEHNQSRASAATNRDPVQYVGTRIGRCGKRYPARIEPDRTRAGKRGISLSTAANSRASDLPRVEC